MSDKRQNKMTQYTKDLQSQQAVKMRSGSGDTFLADMHPQLSMCGPNMIIHTQLSLCYNFRGMGQLE